MRYYNHQWIPETSLREETNALGTMGVFGLCVLLLSGWFWWRPALYAVSNPNAVVFIEVDQDGDGRIDGSGSGALINEKGFIITNKHVVYNEDNREAQRITVWLHSGMPDRQSYSASIEEAQPSPVTWSEKKDLTRIGEDWAVLRITAGGRLPYLSIGDSRQVQPGQHVRAIGFPLGREVQTSKNGPRAKVVDGTITRPDPGEDGGIVCLTHSCVLAGGGSGGPLLDSRGRLIGVNAGGIALASENYAIPAHVLEGKWKHYAQQPPR